MRRSRPRALADAPRALAALALLALAACGPRPALLTTDAEPEVQTARERLADELFTRLQARAGEAGPLYWRRPGPAGPRCEPWRFAPDPDDPTRGHLVLGAPVPADTHEGPQEHVPTAIPTDPEPGAEPVPPPAPPSLRFAYRLADGHLTLTAPEHERPLAAAPGTSHAVGLSLTCVYTGLSLTTRGPEGTTRRLVLDARERFFLDERACADAGLPDALAGPGEVRPLGCASALADPATRERIARPPAADALDAAPLLRRHRVLYILRSGSEGPTCEAWQHQPEPDSPSHGRLSFAGRDERGRFVRTYAYEAGPGALTLQGPTERWQLGPWRRPSELVRASGCLLTRPVTDLARDHVTIGPEPWYLSKKSCEDARRAGARPLPPPTCDAP